MLKRFKPRVTFANAIATIALFAALGGVSYAAVEVPKDSVGTEQIQAEAVRTGKIADEAITARKLAPETLRRLLNPEQPPAAPASSDSATPSSPATIESVKHAETADTATHAETADTATNAETADTATHADAADAAANAEELGGVPAGQYMKTDAVLASGKTEVGDFIAAAPSGSYGTSLIQFWPHLPETMQENHTRLLQPGESTAECPGPGEAEATYLCVYVSWNYHMTYESFISTLPGSNYAGPISGVMYWFSGNSQGNVRGNWAYTAP